MSDDRLQVLLNKYRDGGLTEEDRNELERTLLSSPQARQAFWEHARFHALLARWGQEEWGRRIALEPVEGELDPPARVPDHPRQLIHRNWVRWAAVAAAASIALLLTLVLNWHETVPVVSKDPPPTTLPAGVAVLGPSVEARWADGGSSRVTGSVLGAGPLKLESGAAQIEFYSGARLIIQGPAEVQLVSEMEAFCQSGRLTAYVPAPARGFKVAAPGVTVVDLGTEFGMNVPPAGDPEVHVFTGAVKLTRPKEPERFATLSAGQAAVVAEDVRPMTASRSGFLDEQELARLAWRSSRRLKMEWQSASASLGRDPAALLHFVFADDGEMNRTLANHASSSATGSMVGCGWADGRWSGSRAIEFKSPGDRIRIDVPGKFSAVTLLAWVRIDALPNSYHAILSPDGLTPGTLRWSLTRDGAMRLGIARESGNPEPNWEVVISPEAITPERLGQWVMIATTFDGQTLRHFVNGEILKTGQAYSPAPLVIGPAEVGNWRGDTPRFIQGRMDELAILSRALTPQEIKGIYDAGRPAGTALP